MTIDATLRAAELRRMAANLLRIAAEIEVTMAINDTKKRARPAHDSWNNLNRERLANAALDHYRSRRKRADHLPAELFGEPAWDMLLDLFIARIRNKNISVTSACIASYVPNTTALRWLNLLEQMNLVRREQHETDCRVTWVKLTDGGFKIFVEYFEDLARRDESFVALDQYLFDQTSTMVSSK
ncbi:MAG: MarR family transcriptional regulator [Hyphomicrobiaceae bacterium]|nr:MarR family transcriptional regulator [Hyphomicrobiaceae bacterium]